MEEQTCLVIQEKAATKEPEPLRVSEALKKYLIKVEAMRSEATYSGYDPVLKEFRKTCKKEFLKGINKGDLENFVVAMKQDQVLRTKGGCPEKGLNFRAGLGCLPYYISYLLSALRPCEDHSERNPPRRKTKVKRVKDHPGFLALFSLAASAKKELHRVRGN